MHDPKVVVFDLGRFATVWHNEPQGHDSGVVCKGMGSTELSWHNLKWSLIHIRHLNVQIQPYLRVKRWLLDRCSECGRKFRWRDARFGYMSSDRTIYHDECMQLRHVRSQVDDLTAYVDGQATPNQKFRVEYAQNKRLAKAVTA